MAVYKAPLQLQIPVSLPGVLKDYTKAVLLNQPNDLYSWSAEYFRELSVSGSSYPTLVDRKNIKSNPSPAELNDRSITFVGWRKIYNDLSDSSASVKFEDLRKKWSDDGFSLSQLKELLTVGEFYSGDIDLIKFTALVCGSLTTNLTKTVHLTVVLLSDAPENDLKSARVKYETFETIYKFMASLDAEVSPSTVEKALQYLKKISASNGGYVCAADFVNNKSCPKLE